jgi:hypothetical protein
MGKLYRVIYSPTSFEYAFWYGGDSIDWYGSLKQAHLHHPGEGLNIIQVADWEAMIAAANGEE